MNKTTYTTTVLTALLFIAVCAGAAQASAQRTFVAGPGIGNDSNTSSDCSFSGPCRNFSAAYTVTNTGGEIIALTPGVGYGALTITHAITVTGLPGQVAFVAVAAGTNGITVSAGASDLVVVQNITFNGQNAGSNTGLSHTSGKLMVKNCNFNQLAVGVATSSKMDLLFSDLAGNVIGVQATGDGADTGGPGATAFIAGQTAIKIVGGSMVHNGTALVTVNPGNGTGTTKTNIWLFSVVGGSTPMTNFADNGTFMSGSGTGCTTMGSCQNTNVYNGSTNPR